MICCDFPKLANFKIVIRSQSLVTDVYGGQVNTWTTPSSVWAWIRPISVSSQTENFDQDQSQGMATNAMIEGAGATDVGAETGIMGAQPLTPEAIVAAAPEVIVLPAGGYAALGGPEAFLEIPGIAATPAGANGAFLAYDEAYFFNLGPRTGQALMEFILDLYPELDPGA